jgi:hypothetical protein
MIWNTGCSSSGFFWRLKIIGANKSLLPQAKYNRCMISSLRIYHCFKMRGLSVPDENTWVCVHWLGQILWRLSFFIKWTLKSLVLNCLSEWMKLMGPLLYLGAPSIKCMYPSAFKLSFTKSLVSVTNPRHL